MQAHEISIRLSAYIGESVALGDRYSPDDGIDTRALAEVHQAAVIIVNAALEEMSRISGAEIGQILECMYTRPDGTEAKKFRAYLALGMQAADDLRNAEAA